MSTWDELNKGAGASKVTVASTWDDANKGASSWAEEERKRKQEEEARKTQEQATVQPVEQPRKTGEYRGNIFQKLGQSYFDVIKSIPKQTARGVGMVFNAPENVAKFTSDQLMKNDSYEQFMTDAARGIDLGQGRAAVAVLNTGALGIGDLKPVLNTKVGKDIVTNVADRTSDIPIKTVAAFRAIGEGTYKEYRDAMLEERNDPENGAVEKFLYELQDSGIQSLLGVLITTGTVLATRNPKAGYAIGGAYYGALSASEQIKTKGEVTSSGNIYIDVIGDSLINNALLGVFKMPAAAITRVLATGALEGSTEVVQSLLKFANSYSQAKTEAERQDIMEDAVQYVKSGAILMEFGVGATVGTIAGGASEVLNTYSQEQITELETQRESESKAIVDLGIEERIKRAQNQPIPLYRGQEQGSEGGLHFSDNQKWAENFGGQNQEVLTGTLPADAKVKVLDDSDIRVAADLGYTTDEEMYSYYFSMGYDALIGTDSRNAGELDVIVSPEASQKFDIQPVPVNLGDSTTEVLNTAGSGGEEKKKKPKAVPVAPRKLQEDIQEVVDLIAKADSGQELSVAEQNALPQARESFIDYANAFQATTVSLPNEVAPQEPPIAQVQVVDVGDKFALKYSADAGEMGLYVDYDLKTLYNSPEAANKAAIDSILQWIDSQRNNGSVSPVTQKRLEDIAQKLRGGSEKPIKAPTQPAKRQKETEDAPMVAGIEIGTEVYFAGRPRTVSAIIPFGGDTKYRLTDAKGSDIYTNEAGVRTAIEAKELGISEDEVLKRRNEANGTPKKEKGKVEEKVKVRFDEELGYLALVKKGDGFVVIGTFSTEEKAVEHLKEVTGIDLKTTEKDTKQPEIDEKSSKKTQKDKVKEVIDQKGTATIKDIADITGILEPNIRRILGVGAKDGEFERVDSGVYRLAVGDKDVAFVMAADAVETLPKLAAQGFKADMIFLDIPYETKAVKGGNRGVNYDFLSVADFKKVVTAIKEIARDNNTPVIHMYSQAESGMKEMTAYNEVFPEVGFKPVAKGEWQKTYKDGSPVAFPTRNGSMVTKPEGILVFTLSGETDKQLESLQFKTVRPKGYQTEKAEEMLKAMIEMTTEEGDVVFDPFAGSGVTGAAAVKAGRRTVAIEKNPEVVEQYTKPRIENAVKKKESATTIRLSQKQKEDKQSFIDDVNKSKTYDFKYEVGEPVLVNGEKAIIKERYIDRGRARYVTYPPSKKTSLGYHTQSYEENIEPRGTRKQTSRDTADKLVAEGKPEKAEMVEKNANTLTIVPDTLEDEIKIETERLGGEVFKDKARANVKQIKKLKDGSSLRPETKVQKTAVKDFLAGRDRVVFTVMVEEEGSVQKQLRAGTMYLYEKSETTETYLRPSALGLVEEGLQIGQEVVLDATELKKAGSYFNAVDGEGNILAEGLFTKKYNPEKHEKYFVDYRPSGVFGGKHYIWAIPKGQGAFYRNIIDDARTKSGRLATGHEDVNGKGIWHISSSPYTRLIGGGAIYKGEVNDRIKRQLQINKKALLESYKKTSSAFAEETKPKSRKAVRTLAESEFAAVSKLVQKAEPTGKRPSTFASREPQKPSKLVGAEMNTDQLRQGSPIEYEKLAKRSEIARVLTSKLNAVVRSGKFRQAANGIYKPDSDVVRLSKKNFAQREGGQLTTLIHELGHYIDYSLQEYRKVIPAKEIDPLLENYGAGAASVSKSKKRSEAFAEFVRYYVTIPAEAQSRAPEFYNYFVDSLEGLPEIKDALNTAQSEFRRWAEQPATAKVAAQISFEQKDNDSFKTKLNTTVNAIYRDAVNDLHAIDQFSKLAQKDGKQIEAEHDPAILARNMRGWIGRAQYFLESGTVNRDYWKKGENGRFYVDKKGKSLKEILQPIEDKGGLNDLSVYLVARRAIELAGRNITSGVTEADARVALAELGEKYPEFSQVALDLDTYQEHLLDYLEQSGVLNKDDRAKMREANKMYTPFFRVHEELTNNGYMGGKKIPTNNPIKRLKGSEKDIIDPLESIVKNTYVLLNAAERNNVMLAMANLSKTDKALGRLFEPVPVDQTKVASVNAKEIVYQALGADTALGKMLLPAEVQQAIDIVVPETMVNIFRPAMFQKGNVVTVLEDGKPKYYELEKDLYEAVQSTEVEEVIAAVKILSYPAQFLRAGATLTPEFMLRNPLRDSIGAAVQSQNGFVPFYDTFRGFASLIKKDAYYDAFVLSGGLQSTIVAQDRTNLQQSKDELLKRSARIKKYIKNPLEVLQLFSAYTEQATRIGEARLALNAGKSPAQAAFDAREVTLDYQRAGAKTRSINKLSAFFNAKIQGNDKLMRTFLKNPAKATFKATLYITLPSVVLWLLNQDEEGWDEIPQWQKDMFWLVKVEDTWYRIPKPFELGVLFGSIPERFLEYLKENDPAALQEVTRSFITGLVPNPTPTGAVPILENITNYSFFLDRPIVSQSLENLPAEAQYTNTTSEVAKIMGDALNYSPAKIDNLMYGYFAGLGRHAVNTTDAILKGTGIVNSVPEPAPTLADTPVVKAFVVSNPAGSSSNSVNDFYETRTEVTKKYNRYKDIAETGDAEKAREYLADNPDIKLYKAYNTVASQISEMRKARDAVYNSSTMSPEDKRKKIDELNKLMTDTAYRANHLELQ